MTTRHNRADECSLARRKSVSRKSRSPKETEGQSPKFAIRAQTVTSPIGSLRYGFGILSDFGIRNSEF